MFIDRITSAQIEYKLGDFKVKQVFKSEPELHIRNLMVGSPRLSHPWAAFAPFGATEGQYVGSPPSNIILRIVAQSCITQYYVVTHDMEKLEALSITL